MADEAVPTKDDILTLASEIVAAYASRNQVGQADLVDLIGSVHGILKGLSGSEADAPDTVSPASLVPAVPIDQSVNDDAIICLEDGKPFKTLKRHLRTAYDMSPEEYRDKWGLSKDYPMTAPAYSKRRSATAKKIGLGRKPKAK